VSTADGFDVRSLAVTYRSGHRLHSHSHRWAQLIYARSGVIHVTAGGRLWLTPPTRAIWIAHGVDHELEFEGESALRTLYVRPERAAAFASATVKALEISPLLRELIMHITGIGMLDPQRPEHDKLAGVLMDLINASREIDLMLPLPRDPRALKLANHLRSSPADKQGLDSLVTLTGASLRTLQRCFFEETGMTIEAWRQKARLVHSANALAEGASVTDASLACGYESLSAYIAAFRRQFGVTPKRFRGRAIEVSSNRAAAGAP